MEVDGPPTAHSRHTAVLSSAAIPWSESSVQLLAWRFTLLLKPTAQAAYASRQIMTPTRFEPGTTDQKRW
jgi:hypothetical protein